MIDWNKLVLQGIQQKQEEFLPLLDLMTTRNYHKVLEIGSYSGGTTMAFMAVADLVVSVDKTKRHDLNPHTFIQGLSEDPVTIDQVRKYGMFDVLFIDGDHTQAGCMEDYKNYSRMVAPEGIICFNGILDSHEARDKGCYVSAVWNEICTRYPEDIMEFVSQPMEEGGIGVLFNGRINII